MIDGKLKAEYGYNGWGERIKKTVYSGNQKKVTYYFYDGNSLSGEAGQNGKITAQYVYYNNQPVAKLEGNNLYAIHTDHLGTPQAATDEDGELVWKAQYTPFGKATITTEKIALNLRFSGQYEDAESGMHYNYFRDYDPDMGRYLTSDPIGLGGGLNRYAYVDGDPLRYADSLGLYKLIVGFEVNKPSAFSGGVHDLNVDYGHAFLYLVDDKDVVTAFFSHGPADDMTKEGQIYGVKGTLDYAIGEPSQLFNVDLNIAQYNVIKVKIENIRTKPPKYWIALNNTCAEGALDVIDDFYLGLGLPNGKSPLKLPVEIAAETDKYLLTKDGVTRTQHVNPYALYNQMLGQGYTNIKMPSADLTGGTGVVQVGKTDPLVSSGSTPAQDDDKDGEPNVSDTFPKDPNETQDGDGDGVGDNTDTFPSDPNETEDGDSDGVGNNSDVFPKDPNETTDTDNDGVGDNADSFPSDANETKDDDNDGVGNNSDAFPNDLNETKDTDGDGVGDNSDAFPNDKEKH